MDYKYLIALGWNNFLFWLSRKIDYPLCPPDVVQVNFTFRCNLRCKMCSMHERMQFLKERNRQIEISSDAVMKIIRQTKEMGTKSIIFIGGEPFIEKKLLTWTKYAKEQGLNTIVVTNAVLLNEAIIKKCFESKVDWLSVSIDAATAEKFNRIRGEKTFETLTANIETLNKLRTETGKEFPKMVAVCTIMDDNLEDLLGIVRLCRQLKIEKVLFQPVVTSNIDQTKREDNSPGSIPLGRFPVLDKAINTLIEHKMSSLANFDSIANSVKNLQTIKKYFKRKVSRRTFPCYAGYNRMQIIQEGKVYFCVNQQQYETNFGDVAKDSLQDLWFSKQAKTYRKLIRSCKVPCLQWCAYRDSFTEFFDFFNRRILFDQHTGKSKKLIRK